MPKWVWWCARCRRFFDYSRYDNAAGCPTSRHTMEKKEFGATLLNMLVHINGDRNI